MSTEFETVSVLPRSASYMDSMESTSSFLMEPAMDYLNAQYDANPPSPSFGAGMGSASMDFSDLNLSTGLMSYTYGPSFTASPRSYSPAADSVAISPPTLTYNLSSGEMSSDESHVAPGRRSRGEDSTPPQSSYVAALPRSHRYNPISIPATRASARAAHKRRGSKSSNEHESDAEEEEEYQPGNGVDPRREAVRRQRIESEQRRRDELRDGYSRLKAVLPPSSAKSSKVSLLDRAAMHLKHLEAVNKQAEIRLKSAEAELVRVRSLNEVLSLRAVQQREAAIAGSVGQTSNF